jgi:hypothetical protein
MTTQIIWTALPNGFDASYYYFSVFVSHRLSGGLTLQDYPLGPATPAPPPSSNWAASMLTTWEMLVSFDGGLTSIPAQRLATGMPGFWTNIDPSVWTGVFPSTTPVEDFVPQKPSARVMRSYSATRIVQQHDLAYDDAMVNSGGDYPSTTAGAPGSAADFVAALGSFPGLLDALRAGLPDPAGLAGPIPGQNDIAGTRRLQAFIMNQYAANPIAGDIAFHHYLAYRFYRRSTASQYGLINPAAALALPVPSPTFHKLVGMLADHPTLLRNLGLVLDYRVPSANIAPGTTTGLLQVFAGWNGAGTTSQYPQTRFRITADWFAAIENGDLDNGFLVLAPSSGYGVVQTDPDGHAQKMIAYGMTATGTTVRQTTSEAPKTPPATASLPARRTGGLTVLKADRAGPLSNLLVQGDDHNAKLAANNPADPVVLNSTDVCRGYRIDVWDTSLAATPGAAAWRSLCQRGGLDVVAGSPPLSLPLSAADLEGLVKAAGGTRGAPGSDASDPGEENTLYVHEAVFGWDGWSLCARRPGRTIGFDENDASAHANQHPVVGFLPNHAAAGYPVVSEYAVTPGSLPRLRFGRTYCFRARTVDLAGNGRPASYQAATDPTVPSSSPTYASASPPAAYLRYEPVAAPTLVPLRAFTQGESLESLVIRSNPDPVDDLSKIAPGTNAAQYAATSVAMASNFLDHCDRHVAPPKTSQIMAETHGMLDGLSPAAAFQVSAKESGTLFDAMVWNVDTGMKEALPAGELVFVPEPGPTNPGDPPLPGQYVVHTLPALTLPYLPDPLASGLAVQPSPGLPTPPIVLPYDASGGWPRLKPLLFTVQESATASMGFSTAPGTFTASLPPATLAVVRYSTSPSPTFQTTTVAGARLASHPDALNAALLGGNWLVSPYRELTLVHAVQRPLLIPSFANVTLSRGLGQTFVAFANGSVQNDGHSTGQIDINAAWTDPIDDPANPAGPQTVNHTGRAFSLTVDYSDVATPIQIDALRALPPKRHELGDTKHRWVTYSPDATTRYREYFPDAVTADISQITTKGKTQLFNVLASRRPDPMKVLYALPTFKWATSSDGSTITRTGRGIRIYFDRPWHSSGDDELVGVLLAPAGTAADDPRLKYTSEWGRDPVWSSSGPTALLAQEHFTNRVVDTPQTLPPGLSLPPPPLSTGPFELAEDATLQATVIGFKPEYNHDRNLWFCDIEMDPGDSYFPFVRLALARYQPHAIGSEHLSRVVRTEFLQLVPDRTAGISYGSDRTLGVTVSGVGAHNRFAELSGVSPAMASPPSGSPVSMPAGRIPLSQSPDRSVGGGHRVTALVQRRPAGSSNDLLWMAVGGESELASYAEVGSVFWAGTVNLPATSSDEYRLLIRETERHVTDANIADGFAGIVPYGERLVYAAALALSLP